MQGIAAEMKLIWWSRDASVRRDERKREQETSFAKQELAMKTYRTNKSGFTLVEILIVVIILGILAAIVIPQFTNASSDARNSSLASLLQTIRSQVQLYKLQHGDALPNIVGAGPANWAPLTGTSTFASQTFG